MFSPSSDRTQQLQDFEDGPLPLITPSAALFLLQTEEFPPDAAVLEAHYCSILGEAGVASQRVLAVLFERTFSEEKPAVIRAAMYALCQLGVKFSLEETLKSQSAGQRLWAIERLGDQSISPEEKPILSLVPILRDDGAGNQLCRLEAIKLFRNFDYLPFAIEIELREIVDFGLQPVIAYNAFFVLHGLRRLSLADLRQYCQSGSGTVQAAAAVALLNFDPDLDMREEATEVALELLATEHPLAFSEPLFEGLMNDGIPQPLMDEFINVLPLLHSDELCMYVIGILGETGERASSAIPPLLALAQSNEKRIEIRQEALESAYLIQPHSDAVVKILSQILKNPSYPDQLFLTALGLSGWECSPQHPLKDEIYDALFVAEPSSPRQAVLFLMALDIFAGCQRAHEALAGLFAWNSLEGIDGLVQNVFDTVSGRSLPGRQ